MLKVEGKRTVLGNFNGTVATDRDEYKKYA